MACGDCAVTPAGMLRNVKSAGVQRGVIFGMVAYSLWGLFPLFWPLLKPAGALEILSHRIFWSFVFTAILLAFIRGFRHLRGLSRRTWLLIFAASILIAVNWGVYIYAANNGHVVEAALGYFINPLLSAGLGVVVMKEKLRPLQWTALSIAAAAVLTISIGTGRIPFLALTMAVSFALYGLVKKIIPIAPTVSLTVESMVLLPAALAFLIVLQARGESSLLENGAGHVILLATAGIVTAVPLLAFAVAAQHLPLTLLGFLQYTTPIIQFLLGVYWAHEVMAPSRWVGFMVIWLALIIYSTDAILHERRRRRTAEVDAQALSRPDGVGSSPKGSKTSAN